MDNEAPIRKTLTLSPTMWRQIDLLRRAAPYPVPAASEIVRDLIREALEARAQTTRSHRLRTKPLNPCKDTES
jgi:Arc/MetJ-type ribon-helix-helix transcriptional regulator